MGIGPTRLLRSRSPTEAAAFWIVMILSYLALYGLAETSGVGFSERVDPATNTVSFDLNSFLWLPDFFLRADPATNPAPFLLWWVLLAGVVAEIVMVVFRFLRGGTRPRTWAASGQRKTGPT